jgi:hypothetical protein
MANIQSFCFIIAFHNFPILKNWLSYQCPSFWPVVITMKKKLTGTWGKKKKKREDINRSRFNDNKFATSQILKKPVEVVKGGISFSWLSSVTGEIFGHNRWRS